MIRPGQSPAGGGARIDQNTFVETVADALGRGEAVLLRVQGVSMLPWLREGEKVRILPAAGRRLRRGDIALFWREPGRPILHRVVRVHREEGLYECLGDSENGAPERVAVSAVIGVVETTAVRWILFLALHPVRRFLNRLCLKWGLRLRHD
jgi:hypothetical protein